MKIFDTLYKRTKTGAIQYWEIAVSEIGCPVIQKESGQLGTENPIYYKEDVREGKQKRSAYEQAVAQATSDWTKKHDEGYKSLADLGFIESEFNHMTETQTEIFLEQSLPQFNTDANGNVKPMLAKAVDWNKVKYPCFVQPKLDGVRCLMVVTDDSTTFLSRSGKPYTTLEHIAEALKFYTNTKGSQTEFILDGEIYSHELSFQEIVAAVKKQRPDSLKLKFRAYDIVNDGKQQPRLYYLEDIVAEMGATHIDLVDTEMCYNKEQVKALHDKWVSESYEGAMIRHLDGIYGQGQRSSDLLKVKEFDDSEFKFITFEKGQRDEDLIAICHMPAEHESGTKEFRAKMVGNREQKQEMWSNVHILSGKQLTIKHFGWTDDGLPRFPIGKAFRED